jgi:hypothetical protein
MRTVNQAVVSAFGDRAISRRFALGEARRMLLTITTTHRPATDLGYLLHKHPARFQSFGRAHAFYS